MVVHTVYSARAGFGVNMTSARAMANAAVSFLNFMSVIPSDAEWLRAETDELTDSIHRLERPAVCRRVIHEDRPALVVPPDGDAVLERPAWNPSRLRLGDAGHR